MGKEVNKTEIKISIGNAHWTKPKPNQYVIYIGRGNMPTVCNYNSNLGNPFTVEQFGRDKCIKLYDVYLEDGMLQKLVKLIQTKHKEGINEFILMCWCKPNNCHGNIIRQRLFKLLNQEQQDTSEYCLHSGGAYGADTLFGEYCKQYSITEKHYYTGERNEYNAPNGNTQISEQDYEEGKYKVAKAAKYIWGYQYDTLKESKLIHNWSQVKYSDAVFAIAEVKLEGEPVGNSYRDNRKYIRDFVSGGTGYSVAIAILENKPVFFYAQDLGQWFIYDYSKQDFEMINYIPKLTKQFAGIGTRTLNELGKQAIKQLFKNTFKE